MFAKTKTSDGALIRNRMFRLLLLTTAFATLAACRSDLSSASGDADRAALPVRERVHTEPPLDLAALKRANRFNVTSGKASLDWVSKWKYCKPVAPGFFGFYYVSDKQAPLKGSFALLMVYAADELDWSNAQANERFVEITLKEDNLAVWDSVKVGLTKDELYRMTGSDGWSTEGSSHFNKFGDYGAEFIVIDSVVTQIRVGMYCAE